MGTLKALETGDFRPSNYDDCGAPDYDGLQDLVGHVISAVESFSAETVNGWSGK